MALLHFDIQNGFAQEKLDNPKLSQSVLVPSKIKYIRTPDRVDEPQTKNAQSGPCLEDRGSHITPASSLGKNFHELDNDFVERGCLLKMRTLAVSVCPLSARRLWCERNFPVFNQCC
ncbi:hypothetical protein ElyMa_001264200 [Elysia marginata]|uniref:Reverse transcriptase domain-containing protein n=1 Tax=Elysia marginata TaxID=1093978 RepID=A0AAV4IF81_9GAST|nr:hypothetical protein ElyMa_001264200 [Elysia marginata]